MLETPALIAATAALIPLMLVASWYDLKYLLIPNWLVLCVFAVFLVTGLWGLPFEIYLWRLLNGAVVLAVGFAIFAVGKGKVGGGDMKLIAALVPFIVPEDTAYILLVMSVLALFGLMLHRMIYAMRRGKKLGWEALDQKIYFPVGLLIGITMCIYLVGLVIGRLNGA
ncbi:prepilin peptidase [Rhodobacteraceae bacterium NNCM2]|nr:prepilin peptidase [Coraliihabitans acroporae]